MAAVMGTFVNGWGGHGPVGWKAPHTPSIRSEDAVEIAVPRAKQQLGAIRGQPWGGQHLNSGKRVGGSEVGSGVQGTGVGRHYSHIQ